MPFCGNFAPVFNIASVRRDAPACSGVYGLSDAREWIYVGESDNIQRRLLELLDEVSLTALLRGRRPTGFVFEVCQVGSRIARQDRLVHELEPVINRQAWARKA